MANFNTTRRARDFIRKPAVCPFCSGRITIDYKNATLLSHYITSRGSIGSRRMTKACAKHQRALAHAIKRARFLALLPYAPTHIWKTGGVGLPESKYHRS